MQAESEVANSAVKPQPFVETIYQLTLDKAVNEKGFCPEVPDKKPVEVKQAKTCNTSPDEIADFLISKSITKQGANCLLYIKAH